MSHSTSTSETKNVFLAEVHQQPAVLRELAAFYRAGGKSRLRQWASSAKEARRIIFAGMGTSECVAEAAIAGLNASGLDATLIDAGELLHYPRTAPGMLVLISQSGESIETRLVTERMAHANRLVAITNRPHSSLARAAGLVLPMCAGTERSITTKTYSNTLALLFLMLQAMRKPTMEESLFRLEEVADALPTVASDKVAQAASLLVHATALHFISRGPAMAAAKQAALTFMEGTRITSAAFTGGAFRHGPFEAVDAHHHAVFFIPAGSTFELLRKMAVEVAEKGSHVVVITDRELTLPGNKGCVLKVASFGEELFPLAASTTQELLLDTVAIQRGLDTGEFRYSQKVTEKE